MESSENSRQEIARESLRYERTGYFALRAPAGGGRRLQHCAVGVAWVGAIGPLVCPQV